ncbi:hypothetical protein EZS27_033648, partial [termite gut metagenome]
AVIAYNRTNSWKIYALLQFLLTLSFFMFHGMGVNNYK